MNVKTNELFGMDLTTMSLLHTRYIVFKVFKEDIAKRKTKCPKIMENLQLILKVFALNELTLDIQGLYESGYFSSGMGQILNEALKDAYVKLRP
mmetsp:Transcript_39599/g.38142  ORF Transcript_39599/g.38142 Transcript_39599/m.38142 type:complete len:94 (+) Transcript_39599:1546-1827(+)